MNNDHKNYDFQNGFNYCIEKVLHEINKITVQRYPVSISTGEILFGLKEKIISMHFRGITLPEYERKTGDGDGPNSCYGYVCKKSDVHCGE